MTLRTRLTIWYTLVLTGVLILFGAVVYGLLSQSLIGQIKDALQGTASDILQASRRDVHGISLPPLDLTANVYVQVWDSEGTLVVQSQNLTSVTQPLDPAGLAVEAPTYSTVLVGQAHLLVFSVPIVALPSEAAAGYLEVGSSLGIVDQARRLLLLVLGGGGLAAVAVAALVGYSTARAALHPLAQMTEAAQQISRADDLSTRLPLTSPPGGEVSRLIQAFNTTLERLETLFESQRRFLADVSHELRTPLTTIRGNVDLISRMGKADPESLEAITSEVDRMTRMVKDLLLLAQAESGKLPLAREKLELDTLMLEVYKQANVLAQGKMDVRLGREDQASVTGDRDRLKQMLLNLVANAVEFTPTGGTVTLGLTCVEGWARLTVSDTGPGIPQEELGHIFERFYRLDRSRRRTIAGGAGLGLSIAYWIARSHQGRIEVSSEVGKGSTFSVWLPLAHEASAPTSETAPVSPRHSSPHPPSA